MSTATSTGMWQVRHEGSPKVIDNLTLVEIGAGLQERKRHLAASLLPRRRDAGEVDFPDLVSTLDPVLDLASDRHAALHLPRNNHNDNSDYCF